MYTQKMLEIALRQEQELRFRKFDASDAFALCTLLTEAARFEPKPIAMQVWLSDFVVCSYYMPGTGENNRLWMNRKYNTMLKTNGSSLRAAMELALSGSEPTGWQCDEQYALCGGGFPLAVRGQGRVGVVCVSGLPHLDDHRLLTQTLARYLSCDTELIAE